MTGTAGPDEPDLAELISRLLPRLGELEAPLLAAAGLSMWEYAIMATLAREAAMSQVELSRRTGRDTTRLGRHLSDLAGRGLVERAASADARQRTVALTALGRETQAAAKRRIREAEDALLAAHLSRADADALRRILGELTGSQG
ncbi:MarR family winged helix-turn-helix transcriptional regulator [Tsukamurella sp. 1534]|uniref:MarR family winged helix-turn-helix transcriptional regulator n=1 Tax=Tsukamurella sp. 1534 TaxID=1151061 RepID=UPI0003188C3A|nr:MarR family transcriptional regulator [Tsukamurella sp. 1534]